MQTQPAKNLDELIAQVNEVIALAKDDPRRINQCKEVSNAAGKVIAALKVQTDYAALRGEEPDIPFIGKTSGRPLKDNARRMLS